MDVPTMTMTQDQARRSLRQYRDRSRKKQSVEFDEIEAAYAQLAKGTPLIDVAAAMAGAPRDQKQRPLLSIARADRREVQYIRRSWEQTETFHAGANTGTLSLTFPRPPAITDHATGWALVPLVPPALSDGRDLSTHFILWDVEQWAERSKLNPPRDPYLLKRIGTSHLFAVLGEWDLTEIERSVMAAHRVNR